MRAQAVEPTRAARRRRGADPADRSGAARLDPGVLRDGRRSRPSSRRRSPTGAWPRRRSSRTWAAPRRRSKPIATRRRRTSSCSRRPPNRDLLIEQLDELVAISATPGTKVVVLGTRQRHRALSPTDGARRQRISRRAVQRGRFRPGDLATCSARPGAKPLGRVVAVDRRQGRRRRLDDRPQSRLVARHGDWKWRPIIADFDLGFGTAGLDYNQDPPQGVAEAVFAPERVDANLVDRLLSKCGDNLSLLAAPATLDRLYDFTETSFDSADRRDARLGAVDRPRHSARLDRLDATHAGRRRRSRRRRRRPISPTCATPRTSSTRITRRAAATTIRRVWSSTASACPSGRKSRSRISPRRSRSEPVAVIPHDAKLFGVGRQQRPDDRRNRAEGKDRRDVRRARQRGRGPRRSAQGQARPARSVDRQARRQESLRPRDRMSPRALGGGRRRREGACSVSVPIPD